VKHVSVIAVSVAMAAAVAAGIGRASAPSRIVFTADRLPSLSGEIYRVDPNGQLVDLSNNPFLDSAPLVSPDGQHLAFFSDRSGALSVWESGIDGSGAVQVGPSLAPPFGAGPPGLYPWQSYYVYPLQCPCEPRLAWQPDGDRLALITSPGSGDHQTLFILAAGHEPLPVVVGTSYDNLVAPDWSPDGKVLVAYDGGVVRAFSPDGSALWTVAGARSPWPELWSWSRRGLLALPMLRNRNAYPHLAWRGLRVYDESGHVQFAIRGRISGAPGWSLDGTRLATIIGHRLEVLTATGKRVLSVRIAAPHGCRDVLWASASRVVVGGFDRGFTPPQCNVLSVDLRTGNISSASNLWFETRSADGKVAAFASQSGGQIAVGAAPTAGGAPKTYASFPACGGPLASSLQFVGQTRSLVFVSSCPTPPTDLYSVAPDGTGLQQITTGAKIADPALSPDGTRIAYSGADIPDGGIGIRDSSGGEAEVAPPPAHECHALAGETYSPPDSWPSWSPDGTTILFSRPDCDWQAWLYTVPATGGTPQPLALSGSDPAWGPSQIAYVSGGVWTANPDGTNALQVSTNGTDPAWSADGRLAYLTGNNNTTVVVGATQTQLPFSGVTSLAWSPDGTRFVVTARTTAAGSYDIYTVNTDSSNPTQLTQNYDALGVSSR
jgi:Tol biopolymer transport system component